MLSVQNLQAKSFPSLLVLVKKRLPIEINSKTLSPNTLDRQCILAVIKYTAEVKLEVIPWFECTIEF